jgi:choline dehydrogenase-like flavoprotein
MKAAFETCGIRPGRMPIARYKKCMTTGTCKYCPFGSRFNAQYVLDDLRAEPRHVNLEIRTRTVATRLVTEARKSVIEGVELLDTVAGRSERVVGGTYVLCAGTYESAKLLLGSTGPKWPSGIGNDTDLVGRHIVSHSFLRVKGTTPTNPKGWFQEYDFPTLMSRSWDTPEYQKVGKVFLFKNRVLPEVNFAKLMIAGKTRAQIDAILRGPMQMELQGFYEEKGEQNNRLTLKSGKNRLGLPLMSIQFARHPEFKARTDAHLARMKIVFDAMEYAVAPTDMKVDPPGGHHATGTCRMGVDENKGVTDRDLRVFGTDNLYVCSNAAFPTCSAVNPTLTLTALALRFAEHLLRGKARAPASVKAKGVHR